MKQLALAVANYKDKNGHYPPAYVVGPDGKPWHSWRVLILPYIDQEELFKRYDFNEPWCGPNNLKLSDQMPPQYALPARRFPGHTVANYLAVVGPGTLWPGGKGYEGEPPDGSAATLLLAENDGLGVHWLEPRDFSFDDMSFYLQRPTGISSCYKMPGVAMADGSVRSLNPHRLQPGSLRAMLTAAGNEPLVEAEGGWQLLDDGRRRDMREGNDR